ncbi:MAG: ATP synthase F0 subunit C [Candidatus Rokubacteria bacterium]|nr:ATP synthase F0 subunit C [Candidatus Rokubacteria bacterium]
MRRLLVLVGLAVLALPAAALAQQTAPATASPWNAPFAFLAAGIGLAIAAGLCGLGQGRVAGSAVDAIARQPGAQQRIFTSMILGLAFIESLTLYMFVIAIILVVKY